MPGPAQPASRHVYSCQTCIPGTHLMLSSFELLCGAEHFKACLHGIRNQPRRERQAADSKRQAAAAQLPGLRRLCGCGELQHID